MSDQIRLCRYHDARPTPLIWTFAFNGAEYWCPYCGANEGMFNGCPKVEETEALAKVAAEDKARSLDYLTAVASTTCSRMKVGDEWLKPSELPAGEIEKYAAIRKAWVYPAALQHAE